MGARSLPASRKAHTRPRRSSRARGMRSARAMSSGPRSGGSSVVSVVGAGTVGTSTAHALLLQRVGEVKLIDVDEQRLEGEVLDLQDAFFSIEQASLSDAGSSSDLIIITAGAAQKPGQSRTELTKTNVSIVKSICDGLGSISSDTLVMVVANPCDTLTYCAQEFLSDRLHHSQVIGSGTVLDTNRLRVALANRFNVNISSLHTYVLGEHGDTQFPALSCSRIGGIPPELMPGFDASEFRRIAEESKRKAYSIIQDKGATQWGIGAAASSLAYSLVRDSREVRTISSRMHFEGVGDVCLSVPTIIGRGGVCERLPIAEVLEEEEKGYLRESAESIRTTIDSVKHV